MVFCHKQLLFSDSREKSGLKKRGLILMQQKITAGLMNYVTTSSSILMLLIPAILCQ